MTFERLPATRFEPFRAKDVQINETRILCPVHTPFLAMWKSRTYEHGSVNDVPLLATERTERNVIFVVWVYAATYTLSPQ